MTRTTAADELERWRQSLTTPDRVLPGFDPRDGGAAAELLLLLETPGPGVLNERRVSRDNPTGTARNITRFMAAAGIARERTLIWNAVPWIIHAPGARNRAPRRAEIAAGIAMLPGLLSRLPKLAVVVLAGRVAGEAAGTVAAAAPDPAVLRIAHPSPTFVCTDPTIAPNIVATLRAAAEIMDQRTTCAAPPAPAKPVG